MVSLNNFFEDALLEDYEEAMEVDAAVKAELNAEVINEVPKTTTTADVSTADDMEKTPTSVVVPAPVAPISTDINTSTPVGGSAPENTTIFNTSVSTVVTAPEVQTPSNPDEMSGVVEASGSNTSTSNTQRVAANCKICNRKHQLSSCRAFKHMTFEKRIRMVLLHHYCSRCLSAQHISRDCKSSGRCKKCKGKHHSMLHASNNANKNVTRTENRLPSVPSTTSTSLSIRHIVSFSPTAKVILQLSNRNIPVRAALDLCCNMSYICSSLVANLKLPVSTVDKDGMCRIRISSIHDSSQTIDLTAKVRQMNGINTPVESVSDTVKMHFEGLQLADPSFNVSGKVALVIGPEVAPQIMKGRIYSNPGLPMAQYTIFGWVISGQSPL